MRLYREGLAAVLAQVTGFTVVAALADGQDALARARDLRPDVIAADVKLLQIPGFLRELRRRAPKAAVVALAVGSDATILVAEQGVASHLTHSASLEELIDAIRRVARGRPVHSRQFSVFPAAQHGSVLATDGHPPSEVRLTSRECEITSLLERDLSNKEIAARLEIEVATVKNHVHNVLEKLGVHRRADAVRLLKRAHQRTSNVDPAGRRKP